LQMVEFAIAVAQLDDGGRRACWIQFFSEPYSFS
jgi:hypothetical protein